MEGDERPEDIIEMGDEQMEDLEEGGEFAGFEPWIGDGDLAEDKVNEPYKIKVKTKVKGFRGVKEDDVEFRIDRNYFRLTCSNTGMIELPSSFFPPDKAPNFHHIVIDCNKLTTIPPIISIFTNITFVSLSGNRFREIPEALKELKHLNEIDFRSNFLKDVPEWLNTMNELQRVFLDDNEFTTISTNLTSCKHIHQLILNRNSITDIPAHISEMKQLSLFSISENEVKSIPDSIATLPFLQSLDFARNNIESIPPILLSHIILKRINLKENKLTEIPDSFTTDCALTYFDCSDNLLTDLPPSLRNASHFCSFLFNGNRFKTISHELLLHPSKAKITGLFLGSNQINVVPNAIFLLIHIEILSLERNDISELPDSIEEMVHLQELYLSHNKLSALPDLSRMVNLSECDISFNNFQTVPLKFCPTSSVHIMITGNPVAKTVGNSLTIQNILSMTSK